MQINQPGIYQAFFTGTVLIDAGTTIPSTLTVQLTLNGVPITGAVARHTFTASNEEVTLSMNAPFPVTGAGYSGGCNQRMPDTPLRMPP